MTRFFPIPEVTTRGRILVSGASGYIGRHLIQDLIDAGHSPVLIGRPGDDLQQRLSFGGGHGIDFIQNTNEVATVADQIRWLGCTVLINLSGHFISVHKPEDLQSLTTSNFDFTVFLLECCLQAGCDGVVNIGTAWEFDQSGVVAPTNLYAALKAANDLVARYYSQKQGLKVSAVKLKDTFGRDDTRSKLLPAIKKAAQDQSTFRINSGRNRINLLYIDDVVDGLIYAANNLSENAEPYSVHFLQSDQSPTLFELAALIREEMNENVTIDFADKDSSGLSAAPASTFTGGSAIAGWSQRVALKDALARYFWDVQ